MGTYRGQDGLFCFKIFEEKSDWLFLDRGRRSKAEESQPRAKQKTEFQGGQKIEGEPRELIFLIAKEKKQ